jgi:hypothetical protein
MTIYTKFTYHEGRCFSDGWRGMGFYWIHNPTLLWLLPMKGGELIAYLRPSATTLNKKTPSVLFFKKAEGVSKYLFIGF